MYVADNRWLRHAVCANAFLFDLVHKNVQVYLVTLGALTSIIGIQLLKEINV